MWSCFLLDVAVLAEICLFDVFLVVCDGNPTKESPQKKQIQSGWEIVKQLYNVYVTHELVRCRQVHKIKKSSL